MKNILNSPYKVIEQKAGIRPTVKDRRPMLGAHPVHQNLFVFNGMGTRGIILAPYFAAQLSDLILKGIPIDTEVDIKRFNAAK